MSNYLRSFTFICIGMLLLGIVCLLAPNPFKGSYHTVLVRQYDYYRSIKDCGKILVIGTSSVAFGIDLDVMETQTGRPCSELGLDHDMGLSYLLEASKCNMKSDDVVIIEFNIVSLDTFSPEMYLIGINNRIDMFRYFLPRYWSSLLCYYPKLIAKRYFYSVFSYSHIGYEGSDFDNRGCMKILREGSAPSFDFEEYQGVWRISDPNDLSQEFYDYLNDYVDYCKSLNVRVFFTCMPYYDEVFLRESVDIERWDKALSSKLNAPVITSLEDAMYPQKYIWNYPCHLNTEGAKIRSERLAKELNSYLESE